jgi:hypothetical protein
MVKLRLFCGYSDFPLGNAAPPKVGTLSRILKNIAARHQMTVEEPLRKLERNHPVDNSFKENPPA